MTPRLQINRNSPYYPDIAIFLIIIPLISAINYYLTYTNIQFNSFLALRFSIDTAQGYLAWWVVRAVILQFDKHYPIEGREVKRILSQILLTTIVGLFVIASTNEILSISIKGEWAPLSFYTFDLIIIGIWFFVVNGIYVGLYYHHLFNRKLATEAPGNGGIMARAGNKEVRLSFDEILGFTIDAGYAVCHSKHGEKYYIDLSLNELQENLPSPLFFRLNRQFILSHEQIRGFNRAENGKVIALIKEDCPFPSQISISRTKAPVFKQWFQSA